MDAEGLRYFLNEMYGHYQIPLMVVENGLGVHDELTADGQVHNPYRTEYLREHIRAMSEVIQGGVDLIGYTSSAKANIDRLLGLEQEQKEKEKSQDQR